MLCRSAQAFIRRVEQNLKQRSLYEGTVSGSSHATANSRRSYSSSLETFFERSRIVTSHQIRWSQSSIRSISGTCVVHNTPTETNIQKEEGTNEPEASNDVAYDPIEMPEYKKNPDIEVTDRVEGVFKDVLNLKNYSDVTIIGHILMNKLGVSNDEMMATIEAQISGNAGGGGESTDVADEPVVEEKTLFDLRLTGFEAKSKIKVIKEIRAMAQLGLKEAKELVDNAPKYIMKSIKKEEAEELKAKLEAIGASIEIA